MNYSLILSTSKCIVDYRSLGIWSCRVDRSLAEEVTISNGCLNFNFDIERKMLKLDNLIDVAQ